MTIDDLWTKYKECVLDKYDLSEREKVLSKMNFYNGMLSYAAFSINLHNDHFKTLLEGVQGQIEDISKELENDS